MGSFLAGGFFSVFEKMLEIFFVIAVGYAANRCGRLDSGARQKITMMVMDISLPAMMLAAVLNAGERLPPGAVLQLLGAALLSYAVPFAIAFAAPPLLRVPRRQRGVAQFIIFFGNLAFIGYPVTRAIFGDAAIFYATIILMPQNFLVYSLGVVMVRGGLGASDGESWLRRAASVLLTPCMIASVAALALSFCPWRWPAFPGRICAMLGGVTTPASLLVVGSSLAEMRLRDMFGSLRVYLLAAVRLLVCPLAAWLVFRTFAEPLVLGVVTVMAAMPTAMAGAMLCVRYHADEGLMAQAIFITTLLSLFTLPLVATLLG